MDLLALLRTLRRRWVLILALTVVGGLVGAASSKLNETKASRGTYYKATNTIVVNAGGTAGQNTTGYQSLDQVAIFVTTGEVPDAAAKALGSDQSGRQLAQQIITTTNSATSTVAITATAKTSDEAVRLADTFATQTMKTLDQRAQDLYTQTTGKLQDRINNLTNQNNTLFAQIAGNPPDVENLKAQQRAISNQLSLTYDAYSQLAAQGPPTSQFSELQKAEAVPISSDEYRSRINLGATSRNNLAAGGSSSDTNNAIIASAPSTPAFQGAAARGVLGAFLGLLLGIGLALLIDRLDRRVRTRAETEEAFSLPVLAEVPELTKAQQRENEIVTTTSPLSRYAEAYRAVRSSVLFTRATIAQQEGGALPDRSVAALAEDSLFAPEHDDPLVVMVTSAAPGEGKTSTTANLAAVFSEAGSSVLVVNCDFRRPSIHQYFGVEDHPRHVLETSVPGVKVVTNVLSDPTSNPTQVVAAQRQVVAAARGRFDVILLDTAPLLTANDAVELVGSADMVVLVARLGVTRADNADRTMELLNRLDVPLAGVVLVGATGAANDYYYYYQPGRMPPANGNAPARRAPSAATNGTHTNGTSTPPVVSPVTDDAMFIPEGSSPPPGGQH